MKKLIITLYIFLLAISTQAQSVEEYCADKKIEKNFAGIISSFSGVNFLSRNIVENEIEKALKKELNAKFDIQLENFWGTTLLDGFKTLKAQSENLNIDGFHFSNLKLQNVCKYNYIGYNNGNIEFPYDFLLKYETKITQDDLDKTLEGSKYQKAIEKMNNDETISSIVYIENSNISIKENSLELSYKIRPKNFFNFKPINLRLQADLRARNGKIELCDLKINSKKTSLNILLPIINKFNPLDFGFELDKTSKGKLYVKNIDILNYEIIIDGYVLINKNVNY